MYFAHNIWHNIEDSINNAIKSNNVIKIRNIMYRIEHLTHEYELWTNKLNDYFKKIAFDDKIIPNPYNENGSLYNLFEQSYNYVKIDFIASDLDNFMANITTNMGKLMLKKNYIIYDILKEYYKETKIYKSSWGTGLCKTLHSAIKNNNMRIIKLIERDFILSDINCQKDLMMRDIASLMAKDFNTQTDRKLPITFTEPELYVIRYVKDELIKELNNKTKYEGFNNRLYFETFHELTKNDTTKYCIQYNETSLYKILQSNNCDILDHIDYNYLSFNMENQHIEIIAKISENPKNLDNVVKHSNIYFSILHMFDTKSLIHMMTISKKIMVNTTLVDIKDIFKKIIAGKIKEITVYYSHDRIINFINTNMKFMIKAVNNQLWYPTNHTDFPIEFKQIVYTLLLSLKSMHKSFNIRVPKPLIFMITNFLY